VILEKEKERERERERERNNGIFWRLIQAKISAKMSQIFKIYINDHVSC